MRTHTAWLNKSERRRLVGFQARCLPRILGVPPAYYSRVPNKTVVGMANAKTLSQKLCIHQLFLFAHIARRQTGDTLRDAVFVPDMLRLREANLPRKRGRPRATWAGAVYATALSAAGGEQPLEAMMRDTSAAISQWKGAVFRYVENLDDLQ